jgi:hypothetical protein
MAEDLRKFQTINLADYYNKNGSQYSTMGDITPYSEGGIRFDQSSPIKQGLSNQTPLDAFVEAIRDPEKLAAVQEKSGIEVFPIPATPPKIGLSTAGFTFSPAFTTQNIGTFSFVPNFTAPAVANNVVPPVNAGISVTNNMGNPPGTAPTVTNNMGNPPGTAPTITNNMPTPSFITANNGVSIFNSLMFVDGIANVDAWGFIGHKGTTNKGTDFVGISGNTYNHTGNQGLGLISFFMPPVPSLDKTAGFQPNKHHNSPSDFLGISGEQGNLNFEFIPRGGKGQIWMWTRSIYNEKIGVGVNNIPDIDARGFVRGKTHMDNSDFTGIASANPEQLTFNMNGIIPTNSSYTWNRNIYNDKFPQFVPVDNIFPDPKAYGFTLGKTHKSHSDFVGIIENKASGKFAYNYPDEISPRQSYAFNDSIYKSIMDNISAPTSNGSADGIGQTFAVRGTTIDGKKARYASWGVQIENMYKQIPGKGETNLKREAFNSGFYGEQPFVTRDIGSNWSIFRDGPGPVNGDPFVRGGVGTAAGRVLADAGRIGNFLLSSRGLLFIAANIGMQLTNPRVQSATLAGLIRTRIYPLGLSTLAQTLVNPLGIHLVRHGFGPLETKGTHYEENADELNRIGEPKKYTKGPTLRKLRPFGGGSRFYKLGKELKVGYFGDGEKQTLAGSITGAVKKFGKFIAKLFTGREKISALSGLLGPHSVYGIGRTRIYRSKVGVGIGDHEKTPAPDVASLTQGFMDNQTDGGKLKDHPSKPLVTDLGHSKGETKRYTDEVKGGRLSQDLTQSEFGKFAEEKMKAEEVIPPSLKLNTEVIEKEGLSQHYDSIAYGKISSIQDNLSAAPNTPQDFRAELEGEGTHTPKSNQWFVGDKDMSRVARFRENYGKRGKNLSDVRGIPGGYEVVGLSDNSVVPDVDGNFASPDNALNLPEENNGQLIPFDDLVLFQFKTLQEKRHTVQLRAMLTDLTDTLSPSYQDVGYVGRTSPTYLFKTIGRETKFSFKMYAMTRQELEAQYIRLNRLMQIISPGFTSTNLPIGPIVQLTIGNYFNNIPVVCDSFDISVPNSSPWDIDPGRQLPLYLEVSMGCKLLFNEAPIYDPASYTFTKKDSKDANLPASGQYSVFRTNSNYFNAINQNFGRGEAVVAEE